MNNLDKQYQSLLQDILDNGVEKSDRTGTGTKSVFGKQIVHNMNEGFPLLTTKKMAIKTLMTELKWFLKGDTNIQYLVQNGCNIWNGDSYKNYTSFMDDLTQEEFIEKIKTNDGFAYEWGDLGPIYGKQWRDWNGIDQIKTIIETLKTNPDSRRIMLSAWNVSELNQVVLPPCHYGFQVYTRELSLEERVKLLGYKEKIIPKTIEQYGKEEHIKNCDVNNIPTRAISLMWNQRSVDTFLGLPFNIASYGMLLSLIAEEVGMLPGELIGNLGDTHLYLNHLEQAKEQLSREPFEHLPKLKLNNVELLDGEFDYEILHYHSHPTIKAPLSN